MLKSGLKTVESVGIETKDINLRKTKIAEILTTYTYDQYDNNTIQ